MSGRILLQGGWLVTMVPGSEPARGDLLIEDDRIAAVGQLDDVSDAEVVDARDRIVLPGLVDTHRHMWQTALRSIACDWTLGQYFARMRGQLGGVFRPEDTFAGTLLGMVEALDSGITTVVDWSHNLNGPDHADAAWDALQQGGGRALFSYGATNDQALRKDVSPHTRDVARLRNGVGSDDSAPGHLGDGRARAGVLRDRDVRRRLGAGPRARAARHRPCGWWAPRDTGRGGGARCARTARARHDVRALQHAQRHRAGHARRRGRTCLGVAGGRGEHGPRSRGDGPAAVPGHPHRSVRGRLHERRR